MRPVKPTAAPSRARSIRSIAQSPDKAVITEVARLQGALKRCATDEFKVIVEKGRVVHRGLQELGPRVRGLRGLLPVRKTEVAQLAIIGAQIDELRNYWPLLPPDVRALARILTAIRTDVQYLLARKTINRLSTDDQIKKELADLTRRRAANRARSKTPVRPKPVKRPRFSLRAR